MKSSKNGKYPRNRIETNSILIICQEIIHTPPICVNTSCQMLTKTLRFCFIRIYSMNSGMGKRRFVDSSWDYNIINNFGFRHATHTKKNMYTQNKPGVP